MDNEKKPCCCCGTPAQPEAATAPAIDASAVPTESVTPSCCRHKDRTPEEHKALLNRLSRIEGQVRGIRGMLEKDAYCVDILVQVAAANSALNSFSKELLAQHISFLRDIFRVYKNSTSPPAWRTTCARAARQSWTNW